VLSLIIRGSYVNLMIYLVSTVCKRLIHISLSNAFRQELFYFLLFLAETYNYDMCQRFLCRQKRNFSWIWQKTKNFTTDPIVYHTYMYMTLPKWVNLTMEVYSEKMLFFVGFNWSFVFDYLKNVDTYHVNFSLENQGIKSYRQKVFDKLIWNAQYRYINPGGKFL